MDYCIKYSPQFEKSISKLKKKDPILYEHVRKKMGEICDMPEHFKPLKGPDAGKRRAHIGSFVIKYSIRGNLIKVLTFDHHDKAY
jgi:YafQ family addiction module toxin component